MASAEVSLDESRSATRVGGLAYKWQALIVVIIGTFMVMLDTTIVNIALNRIINVFGATVSSAQLVLTIYMLALAIVMPATGYLSDRVGAKRLYIISMVLFTLGSLLCGLAWSVPSLVVFRALQGLGGGMLNPLGMTILLKSTDDSERGRVLGMMSLPMVVAPVVGPTLGGYLVEFVDWRLIFYINVPIGFIGVVMALAMLRETPLVRGLKFDLPGFLLAAAGFSALLYGLSEAPTYGWGTWWIFGLLFAGFALLVLWVVVELSVEKPLLELRIFRNRTYSVATVVNFILTLGLFSSMFLLPIFLQAYRGLGALETGVLLLPQALSAGMVAPISGWMYDKYGPRPPIILGLLIMSYSTWLLGALDPNTSNSTLALILFVRGIAMGLALMPVMTVALSAYPQHLAAEGSSLTNVLRQLFSAFGTAIFATLLASRQTYHMAMLRQVVTPDLVAVKGLAAGLERYAMSQGLPVAQAKGLLMSVVGREVAVRGGVRAFDDCFLIAAVICLVGIVPSLFLHRPKVAGSNEPHVSLE